jgi:pimeloyl-ACP methyl ester carboxylesterase
VLVDLRGHGGSQGFAPPHSLGAAAADLSALANALNLPPTAVLGHSFGGKVALAWADDAPESLNQLWIVDSTPAAGEPHGSAWEMLGVLRELPARHADRTEAVQVLEERGIATPVAQWITTSLERTDDGFRWKFDLDTVEALLRDFFATDLWNIVEQPPEGMEVHLIKAQESSVLSGGTLARAQKAQSSGRTFVHTIEGGHWVNADNPDALQDLLMRHLPGVDRASPRI